MQTDESTAPLIVVVYNVGMALAAPTAANVLAFPAGRDSLYEAWCDYWRRHGFTWEVISGA